MLEFGWFVCLFQQPLSSSNFIHELDKITQSIVTVSTRLYYCLCMKDIHLRKEHWSKHIDSEMNGQQAWKMDYVDGNVFFH